MNPNNPSHSLRTLTFCALLVAMSIVFSRVLSISTGFLRFNLGSLPVVLAAVLFGPGAGFVVGALADAIGRLLGDDFTIGLHTVERRIDPPPGTPHVDDVVLRAERL